MTKLDLKNLGCPLPTINLRKALKKMEPGDEIEVVCNSKDALTDIKAFAKSSESTIVSNKTDVTGKVPVHTLVIRKKA